MNLATTGFAVLSVAVIAAFNVSSALADQNSALIAAIRSMEELHDARAFEIEIEDYDGRRVMEVETLRNGEFYESYVDPASGQVLADEKENTPFWRPLGSDEVSAFLAVPSSFPDALAVASQAMDDLIKSGSFILEQSGAYYQFHSVSGKTVLVDARTGQRVQ